MFGALGVAGLVFSQDSSPLGWPALVAVFGTALFVGRLSPSRIAAVETLALVQTGLGAGVVYLAIAAQIGRGYTAFDGFWIAKLLSGTSPDGYGFIALTGGIAGAVLWWRGIRVAMAEFPEDSLSFSFKLGIPVVAMAVLIDTTSDTDLNTFPTMLMFFTAGLGGLAIAHLLPESERAARARTWPKVIAGLVAGVLLAGVAISMVRKDMLDVVATPAWNGLTTAVYSVFWTIIAPISVAFEAVVDATINLFSGWDPEPEGGAAAGNGAAQVTQEQLQAIAEEEALFYQVMQVIEWAFYVVLVIAVMLVLVALLRRMLAGRGRAQTFGIRESVGGEVDLLTDAGKLLLKLVPDRLLRPGSGRRYVIPEGPPGIAETFRIYFRLLTLAEGRGLPRPPHETAAEYEGTLAEAVPPDLARVATGAFDRACYGHHPAGDEKLDWMRTSLLRFTTGPQPDQPPGPRRFGGPRTAPR